VRVHSGGLIHRQEMVIIENHARQHGPIKP
jgi:hypothetical protein